MKKILCDRCKREFEVDDGVDINGTQSILCQNCQDDSDVENDEDYNDDENE